MTTECWECIFVSFLFTFLFNCRLHIRHYAYTKHVWTVIIEDSITELIKANQS